ncbi:hypothetical protein N7463_001368 [Penicillium fimorum]|uniref:Uncharacterized protein n=1 Tax=Penicillium fimorum TaxID=1882269 RepID=A0A9X0CBY8_9EURO|nr:hypothetical protein N7463_001368 [Penicillium fimorum]
MIRPASKPLFGWHPYKGSYEDSLVVTHPTTNSPACGLSTAERTGSPVFHTLWSYVLCQVWKRNIHGKYSYNIVL